jgi:hypothetical protein
MNLAKLIVQTNSALELNNNTSTETKSVSNNSHLTEVVRTVLFGVMGISDCYLYLVIKYEKLIVRETSVCGTSK